jgi:hypothetical protein
MRRTLAAHEKCRRLASIGECEVADSFPEVHGIEYFERRARKAGLRRIVFRSIVFHCREPATGSSCRGFDTREIVMRKLAGIQTVNAVEPIPNADAIERIRVLGWWVVVKKGEHQPGDKIVYCEIDSLLPERPEFEFLRPSSFKPAQTDATGQEILPAGFRIKTVKLRGQVSQGICCPDIGGRLSFKVINPKFLLKYDE